MIKTPVLGNLLMNAMLGYVLKKTIQNPVVNK